MKIIEGTEQLLKAILQAYNASEPLFALAVEDKVSRAFVGCCEINPLDEQTVRRPTL